MNRKVLGKNMKFWMKVAGVDYPIFCGKTAYHDLTQDKIEVTHVNSGPHRNYVPGMSDSQINVVGVHLINNDELKVSANYLMELMIRRAINTWVITQVDQDGTTFSTTVEGFLTNVNISRDVTAWAQSTVNIQPTGEPTFSTVIDPPVLPTCEEQDPIYGTLAEGSAVFTSALLIQAVGQTLTILGVTRSGTTYYETSGTPGNLEFKYDAVAGTITFEFVGNPAPLEPVSVNYKIEV